MSKNVTVRKAEAGDLSRIVEIYNHYVSNTHITFDTEPYAVGARTQWFAQFGDSGRHRLLVAEEAGAVIGYACSSNFKPRAAYDTSVETSIYLDPANTGQGHGRMLYCSLLDLLIDEGSIHRAYGGIAMPNDASVALHEQLGFRLVGTYHEVGYKFDRYWDVGWYEKEMS